MNKKIIRIGMSAVLALVFLFSFIYAATIRASAETLPQATLTKDIKVNAGSALLMDATTGTVIYEQNAKEHLQIASMVKIMTLLLTFEDIEAGKIGYNDDVVASERATSMGGSQAFLDTNNSYKLSELIKSIVVGSANDSCVAVAEHIAGSVDTFVARMNQRAAELGMQDTRFANCTGLPDSGQYSCAADAAKMSRALFSKKDFYNFSTVWMFDFAHPSGRVTQLANTNKLLKALEGCDGGKTGFTNDAMFCLSATAKRGNTRLISVVLKAQTSKERNAEVAKLLNYGFANFETKQLIGAGEKLENKFDVKNGKEKTVEIAVKDSLFAFVRKGEKPDVKIETSLKPLKAPLKAGDCVGTMSVSVEGKLVGEVELIALNDVSKLGYLDIVDDMISNW